MAFSTVSAVSEKPRILSAYLAFSFRPSFWEGDSDTRAGIIQGTVDALQGAVKRAEFYQVYPARAEYDFFAWTTVDADALEAPDTFMADVAKAMSPYRRSVCTPLTLVGITKPSVYVKPRENPQEIDPYGDERKPYFVIYPFSKTADWYMKDKDERMQLMAEHIRVGKKYPAVKQLLLYSFGIQDQEFIVSYEMDDLPLFSDLVQELRSTSARAYTLLDTPIITGTRRTPDQLVDIFAAD